MHDMSSSPKAPTTPTTPTTDLSRRTRSFCSTSTTSTSSVSSPSSSHQAPFTPSSPISSPTISSSIPFSWEEHPGIPKPTPPTKPSDSSPKSPATPALLPLPPPLRSNSEPFVSLVRRKKRPDFADLGFVQDPFTVALMECCKPEDVDRWKLSTPSPSSATSLAGTPSSRTTGRRLRRTGSGRFGFGLQSMDLYGSCKATCTVVDSAVYVPRSAPPLPAYNLLNRRPQ